MGMTVGSGPGPGRRRPGRRRGGLGAGRVHRDAVTAAELDHHVLALPAAGERPSSETLGRPQPTEPVHQLADHHDAGTSGELRDNRGDVHGHTIGTCPIRYQVGPAAAPPTGPLSHFPPGCIGCNWPPPQIITTGAHNRQQAARRDAGARHEGQAAR